MVAVAGLGLSFVGCKGPLERTAEQELREHLVSLNRQHLEMLGDPQPVTITRPASDVERRLSQDRLKELDDMSAPALYTEKDLPLGPTLTGATDAQQVSMSLMQAIRSAVQNSLEIRVSRLLPASADTQIVQAEAVFDAVVFSNTSFSKTDEPRPAATVDEFGGTRTTEWTQTFGIKKALSTGGQIELSTQFGRTWSDPSFFDDPSYYPSNVAINMQQPLLRNFGSDVNRANILLARNAKRRSNEDLKLQVLNTVFSVEQAYWNLQVARYELYIRRNLFEQTLKDRSILEAREQLDVSPATITDVNARVESRKADIIRAEAAMRLASDSLKRILNDPDLPLAGELLINPVDTPVDLPVTFSYLDAISTAMQERPEMIASLSNIDDATIRQRVADNARLPVLNLLTTVRYNGIGQDARDSYDHLTEGDYIDYLVSLQFEQPLGNREANAAAEQRQIEKTATVLNYQRTAQDITLEVKDALRAMQTTYRLVGATRASRRAAADNLRTLQVQEEAGGRLSPEFIDLKLRREEAVADSQIQEIRALAEYNTSIARYYQTLGTLLERNSIRLLKAEDAQVIQTSN